MFAVIDRIVGNLVVTEGDDGKIREIERHLLPENLREGDVIDLEDMSVNLKETERRKDSIRTLVEDLFIDGD